MPTLRAMVVIPKDTNISADAATNNWSFTTGATDGATLSAIVDTLGQFYVAIHTIFSNKVAEGGLRCKIYNLGDPVPRPPLIDTLMPSLGAAQATILPPELAICLSFQGARVAGVPQARRRGRVYLGPLGSTVYSAAEELSSATLTLITGAAGALLSRSQASGLYEWVVVSGIGEPIGSAPVTNGWVDNAFDVQRRRGIAPSARQVFP